MGPRTAVVKVDASWTKKELISECKRRGISGYSRLDKASIICCLNKGQEESLTVAKKTQASGTPSKEPTVRDLREECRKKGLRSYSKLRKSELVRSLQEHEGDGGKDTKKQSHKEPTLAELRMECQKRGMKGFIHLKKEDLLRRMEDYSREHNDGTHSPGGRIRAQHSRSFGPLRSRAQERFDAGPTPCDTPGFIYVYFDPQGEQNEWKVGKTTLDPPERRMRQSAVTNSKKYQLKASWYVPWCGYVEKIVHLDLDDMRIFPGKEKVVGIGVEDGGTEWFRGEYEVVEARIRLSLRMVTLRAADEADANRTERFCGFFRCELPPLRRRRQKRVVDGVGTHV